MSNCALKPSDSIPETSQLIEQMVKRNNMFKVLKRVRQNASAPGIDKMTVGQLPSYLKRTWTRFKNLTKHGIPEERVAMSAFNKRGPWFNSGASHMNQTLPKKFFDNMKLVSLLERLRWNRLTFTQGTAVYGTVHTVV